MALTMPYVTDTFTAYAGDVITTNLSLAVWLTDEYTTDKYTKEKPIGRVRVTLKEGEREAFRNLSGYYCFTAVPDGNYHLRIESEFYFPVEKPVAIPLPDPKNPVNEIELKPHPGYPFPENATLVRGVVVLVSNTNPVVGADVKVVGKLIETITDEKGEFVLFCEGIKKENVTIEIKKGTKTKVVNATVEEGKTVSMGRITFP